MIQIAMTVEQFLDQRSEMPEGGQWAELHAGVPVFLEPPDVDHGTVSSICRRLWRPTFTKQTRGMPASIMGCMWGSSRIRCCSRR